MTPDDQAGFAVVDGERRQLTRCDSCGEYYSCADRDHYCGSSDPSDEVPDAPPEAQPDSVLRSWADSANEQGDYHSQEAFERILEERATAAKARSPRA